MPRPLSLCLLLVSLLAAPARGGEEAALLRAQLGLEQRLFAEDLRAYGEAREREKGAVAGETETAAQFDSAIVRANVTSDELTRLETRLAVARAAVEVTAEQVKALRTSLRERTRRMKAIEQEIVERSAAQQGSDPVSGRWRIEISSPAETGTFELRLEGAQVEGTYTLSGGRQGSLRGTYIQGRLRLERIDAQKGLDGTFEGTLDVTFGTVRGFWSPSQLAEGGPGGSGWSGIRVGTTGKPPG